MDLSGQALAYKPRTVQAAPEATVMKLRDVLLEIQNRHRVNIVFNDQQLRGVTVNADKLRHSGSVARILHSILEGSGLQAVQTRKDTYLIIQGMEPKSDRQATPDRAVLPLEQLPAQSVVFPKEAAVALPIRIHVSGRVTDKRGDALPGVSILIKGTQRGTITNQKGEFSIEVPDENARLVFSFVGYISEEVAVRNRTSIDISLDVDEKSLEEVVVIGYGTEKKGDLTGSVGIVNLKDIEKAPAASFTEALAGRIAGVQVSSTDGQPGNEMDIVIRGANSMTQENSPLYVIDGFPLENFAQSALNTDDIASITVLKDASATAIYGSRAANGVIVIETKRGSLSKPVVSVNSSYGVNELTKKMDLMSPYEFVKYQSERNAGLTAGIYFTNGKTLESYRDMEGIDMQDHLFRPANLHIHNIALRGGNSQTRYSISGSVYDQQGIILNSDYKRYQGRISIDQSINKRAKVGANFNYSRINTNGAPIALGSQGDGTAALSNYLFFTAWAYRPVAGNEGLNEETSLLDEFEDPLYRDFRLNPIVATKNNYIKRYTSNLIGNMFLEYALTDDLVLNLKGAVNHTNVRADAFYNSSTNRGRAYSQNVRGVNADVRDVESATLSTENTLTYKRQFTGGHNLAVIGGFSMQDFRSYTHGYSSQNIPNESLVMSGIDEGTAYALTSVFTENGLMSFFGRVNYGYKSRYLVTATLRRDGSSKFAPENRWGIFPSAALAWNIHNEEFVRPISFLSNAKIRLSHGLTGNNRIGDFSYLPALTTSNFAGAYSFNNAIPNTGAYPTNMGNRSVKWESTAQTDLGLDLGFFRNRIELSADLYRKTTRDLLLNAQMPYNAGFGTSFMNIGRIENTGLELTLNTINVQKNNFKWETNFNISFNRNKILELVDGQNEMLTSITFQVNYNMPSYISRIGQPMGQFWGLIHDGNYQLEDFDNPSPGVYTLKEGIPTNGSVRANIRPGDIRYKDLDGDGVVGSLDRTIIGSPVPKHIGGITNSFLYKGFDLGMFFQWSYGNQLMNANRYMLEGNSTQTEAMNQFASYIDRWTPENPTNKNFRAGGQGPLAYSSRVIEDGSYIRLKTLSLGYSLPKGLLNRAGLQQVRVHVTGQNLMTWTGYSGMDPEVSVRNTVLTGGFDFSAYPRGRIITVGLNLSF